MQWRNNLPVAAALLLAIVAAVVSSRQEVHPDASGYSTEAFAPQATDLGKYSADGWRAPY
jgi:hypothetical protein